MPNDSAGIPPRVTSGESADWKNPFHEGVVYYLRDGRVRGVLLWNTWGQVEAARQLILEPGPFTPRALKDRLPV